MRSRPFSNYMKQRMTWTPDLTTYISCVQGLQAGVTMPEYVAQKIKGILHVRQMVYQVSHIPSLTLWSLKCAQMVRTLKIGNEHSF